MTFSEFNFSELVLQAIDFMGYQSPTPVQERVIPVLLSGKDVIACAQTGTGKTAAFLLPILENISHSDHQFLSTLIIVPTRELALQIDQQIEGLGYYLSISSISIYGGGDGLAWEQQRKALSEGADIVTATPGRLISLLANGQVDLSRIRHLVLDEADRMLDMGFYEDIIKIISYLPKQRQTMLFSATMPPRIRELAKEILHQPAEVSIAIAKPAEGIRQMVYLVYENQKEPLIHKILSASQYNSIILFASTKEKVKSLYNLLKKGGFPVKAFHSDLDQTEREQLMRDFRNRKIKILVGTDVLSRGIDVEGIDLVMNFDAPADPEDYVHRIGRTARAENIGTAITLVNEKDFLKLGRIEKLIERSIPRESLPAELGPGPVYNPNFKPGGRNKMRNKNRSQKHRKFRKKQ